MGLLGVMQSDPEMAFLLIVTLIFSLCFHEFSHAYIAYRLGDKTAAYQGRLTLNPLAHLDPFGSMMLLFFGFGYAKPVPVNPLNLHNPRVDMMKVAFAGPASNLFLCLIGCLLMRFIGIEGLTEVSGYKRIFNSTGNMLFIFSRINMILAIFNMIPIHPLDGGQIFGGFLEKVNPDFSYKLRIYGPQVLMAIIFLGIFTNFSLIGIIIKPFIRLVYILAGLY
jgi:Zn-dependent protease|tara:strand:+ start:2656 stop:3321 length:666 start_codon:yes stop_codon:yes gene_type:complete